MLLVLRALLDLVLPVTCAGCGAEATVWCRACADSLHRAPRPAVLDPRPAGLPPTWAVAGYEGAVRAALLAHKEHGVRALAGPLGAALAASVRAAGAAGSRRAVVLVPAPSRPAAVRARGRDPTRALAEVAAAVLRSEGVEASVVAALRMSGRARDQAGLGAAARAANLAGAVRAVPARCAALVGRRVLLVDDVLTTGATLAESARALAAAGAPARAAAVVAATPRRAGERGGLSPARDRD